MRWIHAWKDTDHYLNDQKSPLGKIWKDFIVYDDRKMVFGDQFLSEARTPGSNQSTKQLPDTAGVVLHWQFARWNITQYKQALYRCLELLEGNRSARRINNTYSITLDNQELKTEPIPYIWTEDVIMPETQTANVNSYKEQIIALFNLHGVEKFEPLQIWHISELRKLFIKTVGREPIPSLAPKWLLKLNDIKNLIKKHV